MPVNMMLATLLAIEWPLVRHFSYLWQDQENIELGLSLSQKLAYYIPLCTGTMIYALMNLAFLGAALVDITRRNFQMHLLSSALEVNFQQKDSLTIRLPTLNFIDPKSMTAWLEARKLVLDIGSRFIVRI
jgi:hypothetical protein